MLENRNHIFSVLEVVFQDLAQQPLFLDFGMGTKSQGNLHIIAFDAIEACFENLNMLKKSVEVRKAKS